MQNKTLVKLDLSGNALNSTVASFVIEAMKVNTSITELNLSSNVLENDFAYALGDMLIENEIVYKVDISHNPIGPEGAKYLLGVLLERNDTLASLGDLTHNVYMGVRIREELQQALELNNASHDKKKSYLEQITRGNIKNFVDTDKEGTKGSSSQQPVVEPSATIQAEYPLLKPITFTNVMDDDYVESLVWNLRS